MVLLVSHTKYTTVTTLRLRDADDFVLGLNLLNGSNVALGQNARAPVGTSLCNNIFIGTNAGAGAVAGAANTAANNLLIGHRAGQNITGGSTNVLT